MSIADPTPEEKEQILDASKLERLNKSDEFQFFKQRLLELISGSYDVFLGAATEADLWRAQGEARMAQNVYRMVEDAHLVRQQIQGEIRRRSEAQAAAEMSALDLDAQQRLDHFRRTRRQPS